MRVIIHSRPNEQRKVEKLLLKLANLKPVSAKNIPMIGERNLLRSA